MNFKILILVVLLVYFSIWFSKVYFLKAFSLAPMYYTKTNTIALNSKRNAAKRSRQHLRIQQRSSSTEGRLPPQVVFHRRSSSSEGRLPPKVIFHPRSSFTQGRLPPKVVFHRSLSSSEGCLPLKVVFH